MKIKAISLFICLLLIVLCFVGCKDTEGTDSDVSSNTGTTSSIPIVIVDDGDENDSEATQSELDEIINDWENNNPTINIEVDTDDKDDNSSTNGSDATTSKEQDNNSSNDSSDSSTSQESSDNGSTDNSTDNSSNTDSSETGSEDDGYFDVAV